MIKFNKHFKSSIDQFLEDFDKQHPERSFSQQEESRLFNQYFLMRDFPVSQDTTSKSWEEF